MIIKYKTSVKVEAGWRDITILAECEKTSEKMTIVTKVLKVDGEIPTYEQSRTGAKRQLFNGHYIAKRETGAKKRLSSCEIIQECGL